MITLKRAIEGYLLDRSTFLSPETINEYTFWLNRFSGRVGETVNVSGVNPDCINRFFHYLREEYVVTHHGIQPVEPRKLSPKSLKNAWISLSAFWKWCERSLDDVRSPMTGLKGPKVYEIPIEPYNEEQIRAMLTACDRSRPWTAPGKYVETSSSRPTCQRDRAIILFLLDSGVRASEFCKLDIRDFDAKTGAVHIRYGKGGKSRHAYIGAETRRHLWRYLAQRFPATDPDPDTPLFATRDNERFTRTNLRRLLSRLGRKTGIHNVGVHRFRHTFAIMFLRGGGRELALQRLLGHASLSMTKRYVAFAQEDLAEEHRAASPSDRIARRA